MAAYDMIAEGGRHTVLAEYTPERGGFHEEHYQSEAELEQSFIHQLTEEGYEYLPIHKEADLISNLRHQLEVLNGITFSDNEWKVFFKECLANTNEGIVEKTRKIQQQDTSQQFRRDDGSVKNIILLDKKHIHNNHVQVINQYVEEGGNHDVRYDVTILVNGLPLVHVELKRRGVSIREAFNQINRYQRDSFWASSGLFQYVQIFVISNGTDTRYYSNTTRDSHIKEATQGGRRRSRKTSNSFEFTSHWADSKNHNILDLRDFTKTFFAKHTLLAILTRYCVFTTENVLMIMRPYQIAATEAILNRIEVSTNAKWVGSIKAGGYIWHSTGSGKTLTSFKTAQLATKLPYIDKVLFVVDRKDLDYQTMLEYDRFQKGCANGNRNTKVLQKQLEDPQAKIIITTIQKLDTFIKKNPAHDVYRKHVVIIFDECHRSQFGDMHKAIVKHFRKYHIFGFTGTPIFAQNAKNKFMTTEQLFGDQLHQYIIVDAIRDHNVLPFRIDYINTIKEKPSAQDEQVQAIDEKGALEDPQRISLVAGYVLDHFDQKTKRSSFYDLKGQRVAGFNSIFACDSIPMLKKYYEEFKRQMDAKGKHLTMAAIFSYTANEEEPGDVLPDEDFDTGHLDKTSRDFLDYVMQDYNREFNTNFSTDGDGFENYYKDISQRMKNRDIDMLLVVNMFLTGFDATTLNTLWVDKKLRQHGLIQAFSRTNRILNSVKTFGNIVCFRRMDDEVDQALAMYGDKDAKSVVLLKDFKSYYEGYKDENGVFHPGYKALVMQLRSKYPPGEEIVSEKAQKDFINLYGAILRIRNILTAFDDFAKQEQNLELLSERDRQDYQSMYIGLYESRRPRDKEKVDISDDVVFEMELVRQVEVNIDYILDLVEKYHAKHCEDKDFRTNIRKAMDSSIELRSKKELIEGFLDRVDAKKDEKMDIRGDFHAYVAEEKKKELDTIIHEEGLNGDKTKVFMDNSFQDGELSTLGTDIDSLLPPMSRFGAIGKKRAETKAGVIAKLKAFFEKYFGL